MRMQVMAVGHVVVRVSKPNVGMLMAVRLAWWITHVMRMAMVLVMDVPMAMQKGDVIMFVFVAFRQV